MTLGDNLTIEYPSSSERVGTSLYTPPLSFDLGTDHRFLWS